MARMFHREEWYDLIAPTSMLETEFEQLLIQYRPVLHPNAWLVPFKKTVLSIGSSARADLALIAPNYRDWTVIEVEMNRHSLHHHVLPQVRTLRDGRYGAEHADYLADRHPSLDRVKLYEMMRGQSPSILVIVDRSDPEWTRELSREGAHIMVFETYRSEKLNYIFSVDGELRSPTDNILTELALDPILPNMVVVSSPVLLGFAQGERRSIIHEGRVTEWERIDIQTSCYITSTGLMPLRRGTRYALVGDTAERLEIVEHPRSGG